MSEPCDCRKALERYGEHEFECDTRSRPNFGGPYVCTCGLEAARAIPCTCEIATLPLYSDRIANLEREREQLRADLARLSPAAACEACCFGRGEHAPWCTGVRVNSKAHTCKVYRAMNLRKGISGPVVHTLLWEGLPPYEQVVVDGRPMRIADAWELLHGETPSMHAEDVTDPLDLPGSPLCAACRGF